MNKIMRLAIWKNSLLVAAFILLEISGIGPIAMYRVGKCYEILHMTGHPVFWLIVYTLFFFVWPVIDLLAIILKPRITVNNYSLPGQ
jgi:hypothetical protein